MPKKANGPGAPAPTGALGWHEPTQSSTCSAQACWENMLLGTSMRA